MAMEKGEGRIRVCLHGEHSLPKRRRVQCAAGHSYDARMPKLSRRQALRAGLAAAAAPFALDAASRAADGKAAEIRVGMVGFGIRARELLGGMTTAPLRVVAVCEVDDTRRADAIRRIDERHGAGTCRGHVDYRELVGRGDIDAVVVATPDHWHALPAIAAARAGKHVYCEKPMSLTVREGRAIADAAKSAGIAFQVGSQQRTEFGRRFVRAVELVRNGRIGAIRRVEVGVAGPPKGYDLEPQPIPEGLDWDRWCGPSPKVGYHPTLCPPGVHGSYPGWRGYREFSTGYYADMGAHHFDIVQWALNMDASGPVRIEPPAGDAERGLVYRYANGVEVAHGGDVDCHFMGTDGWIKVSRGSLEASRPEIVDAPLGAGEWQAPRAESHIANWVDAIRHGTPTICTAEVGHRSASVCQLGVIGYRLRVPLTWDPAAERFTGAHGEVANDLLTRRYREQYAG